MRCGMSPTRGVSNESLFYTPEGSSIVRRDSAGQETTILEGAALATRPYSGQVPAWVDEAWLNYAQANALLRVPSVGGSLEVLVESTGIVEAISGDACNLYWLETSSPGPAALMVRAIEP